MSWTPETRRRRHVRAAAIAVACALVAAAVSMPPAGTQESEAPQSVVLFIIDLSGSMNEDFGDGRTKLEVAKEAFNEAFSRVPDDAAIGLRVYGDQFESQPPATRQANCENDTRLAVPIASGNRDAILQQVNGFEARGDTPISLALQRTAEGDIPEGALATVVLFSDGRDECFDADLDGDPAVGPSWGPDPCVVAEQIAGEGVDLRIDKIDTVGFGAAEAEDQLRCIAESTGGTFTPITDPVQAREVLPGLITELGTPREAVRLGGEPVEGTPTMEGAPEVSRIAEGETNRRYTDTIAAGEERWYRIRDYGPGPGDTTVTVFGLPAEEGITLELRMEPGPDENISSGLTQTNADAGIPRAPSAFVRCGGCRIRDEEVHDLFFVVALRAGAANVPGTYDLELLLEGTGWGGLPTGCAEGETCWYEAQITMAQGRRSELQRQLEGRGADALRDEVAELEDELEMLTAQRQELEDSEGESTNWLLPILLGIVALGAGGLWLFQARRAGAQPAVAGATTPASRGVIGTIDLGGPAADDRAPPGDDRTPVTDPSQGDATSPGAPSGSEVPEDGREVPPEPSDPGREVPREPSEPDTEV